MMEKEQDINKTGRFQKTIHAGSNVLALIFILIGTTFVIAYANGYRLNRTSLTVERTGVINVRSYPSNATLSIDGNSEGKTEKTVASLPEDTYNVKVERAGYLTWERDIMIPAEKSTPVIAYLFREKPITESLFKISDPIYEVQVSEDHKYILIVSRKDVPATQDEDSAKSIYKVWRYNTNPRFWDAVGNPRLILEVDLDQQAQFSTQPSPDGNQSLVTIKKDGEIETYLINTDQRLDDLESARVSLAQFIPDYTITWAQDSRYLVLESDKDLISFDTDDKRRYFLNKKAANTTTVWQTDSESNIYYVREVPAEDSDKAENVFTYEIRQQSLQGTESVKFIEGIKLQSDSTTDDREVYPIQMDMQGLDKAMLRGSEIVQIHLDQDSDSLVMISDQATYWYSLQSSKFTLVDNNPVRFAGYNEDNKSILFNSGTDILIFTYDKEERDHTVDLGTRSILRLDGAPNNLYWHRKGHNLFYTLDAKLYVIDTSGFNNYEILDIEELAIPDYSGDKIMRLRKSDNTTDLEEIRIHD